MKCIKATFFLEKVWSFMGPPTFLHNMHNYQNTDQASQKTPKKPKVYFSKQLKFWRFFWYNVQAAIFFFKLYLYKTHAKLYRYMHSVAETSFQKGL